MKSAAQQVGTLEVAVAHAMRLLEKDPRLAADQALEILKAVPAHPHARLILGAAYRMAGAIQAALEVLEPLAREQPRLAPAHLELAIACGESGRRDEAIAALRRVVQLKPDSADGWRLLADSLDLVGDAEGADQARARYLKAAARDPRLMEAAAALLENRLPLADQKLRAHLARNPTDVAALRMLAELASRLSRSGDAQRLLEQCLERAPNFDAARLDYAIVLIRQGKPAAALPQVERLLAREPRNPEYRNLQAAILAHVGDYAGSIEVYKAVLAEFPGQPTVWMSYGHSLKTARRREDSIVAYRRAIAMQPTLGEAYWSLANFKTFRFSPRDMRAIRRELARQDLGDYDRLHFEFALGKALEDVESYEESFTHYDRGNAIRRRLHPYSADKNRQITQRAKAQLTPEFLSARAGAGCPDRSPIFIVGLPRSGSTLIEQILASHPLVEGTMELADIPHIAHELAERGQRDQLSAVDEAQFFDSLAALTRQELTALGEQYLASTAIYRKSKAPFFIDKMPNNFLYIGLIQLILPNAKIIDARRHPLGCGFSVFKQQFGHGQNFSYGLEDIGAYYRDYVALMAHVDAVLPGRVHRVIYESMVEDTEAQVRRLLDHCGLPFEAACLRFYDNDRAVRTASSEQVRRPIFKDGIDHWRHYEPWLGPLQQALGELLACYPGVPGLVS